MYLWDLSRFLCALVYFIVYKSLRCLKFLFQGLVGHAPDTVDYDSALIAYFRKNVLSIWYAGILYTVLSMSQYPLLQGDSRHQPDPALMENVSGYSLSAPCGSIVIQ